MSETDNDLLRLVECPVFDDLGRVSVAFACELTTRKGQSEPTSGYRLADIYRELFGPADQRRTRKPDGNNLMRARRLFEGSRSFLDDITTGPPGVNGRPLMLSAAIDGDGWAGRRALIVRPPSWRYEFESAEVELNVPEHLRRIEVVFNDHFCVFESGRIFYLAIFGQDRGMAPRLDEYGLIQLERLLIDPQDACSGNFIGFAFDDEEAGGERGEVRSLREFIERRLEQLARLLRIARDNLGRRHNPQADAF